MNVGKLIVEGALNGIGFALGTIILGTVFAVLAFLAHNLIAIILAPIIWFLVLHILKKYLQDFRRGLKDQKLQSSVKTLAINKRNR